MSIVHPTSSLQHACVDYRTSTVKVEEADPSGRSFISPDGNAPPPKDKLVHMLVFTILFLNILSLEHALILMAERSPFVVGSFTVRPVINAADQRGWHPQDTITARVDVYTRGVLCWEARNTLLREELRPHAVGCEALQVSNDVLPPPTAPDSLSVPTVDQPTCCHTVFLQVLMVVVAGCALYRMPSVLTAFDRLCGRRGFHRLTTFSALCALLALAGNLKVLHNASKQAARLTFTQQGVHGVDYLPEIAPQSVSGTHLFAFGLSMVPIMFSLVLLILSIFAAWLSNEQLRGEAEWEERCSHEVRMSIQFAEHQRNTVKATMLNASVFVFMLCACTMPPLLSMT